VRPHPLEVGDAGRDRRVPRHPDERRDVRAGGDVLEPGLRARDDVVRKVRGHDRGDEVDAILGRRLELPDRQVLAAGHAVQVRVLQPDRLDAFESDAFGMGSLHRPPVGVSGG
jgi:hypothetical protein